VTRVEVNSLFPTPVAVISDLLDRETVQACVAELADTDTRQNAKSELLSHTDIVDPAPGSLYHAIGETVTPHLAQFGKLLFGETLSWSIKEMWTNVLEPGGQQAVHVHSNSFISGIIYLTASHPSARTVFHRSMGGHDFVFSNDNNSAEMGPFNGNRWVAPSCDPGDMVLFPSYMLHEVPKNEGQQRMSIAFNAIPNRLDTWGYSIRFSSQRSSK
jgi:uncharacterized protein (TIGR02466 family)